MKETLEQKKRRLYGKKDLDKYLKELNAITNIEITKESLLSITESDKVVFNNNYKSHKEILFFNDKESLLIFIGDLLRLKDGPSYLFTAYSKNCGLLIINSLRDFNVNFNFDDEHSGLIVIMLQDLSNKLLLDFYEKNNEFYIEVETYGDDWTNARI